MNLNIKELCEKAGWTQQVGKKSTERSHKEPHCEWQGLSFV